MSDRVDCKVLKWFGHLKRMSVERLTERIYESDVEGRKDRGKYCTMWRDRVKKACNVRFLELSDSKVMYSNR